MKTLEWMGSSREDLKDLPADVRAAFGYGLYLAQTGERAANSKALKGFGGAVVHELIDSDESGTYRAVYTLIIKTRVIVLHVFQKKSKHGIATPKKDIDLIQSRLKLVKQLY